MNKFYYHFYIPDTPSHWQLLLYEQLDCIEGSLLHYHCEIEICVSSNKKNYKKFLNIIKLYPFVEFTWFDTNIEENKNHYEGTTLLKLYNECHNYENVGYIHSKSITTLCPPPGAPHYPGEGKQVNRWRKVLEYGVIEKWSDNIKALKNGYDISGICWDSKLNHFVGNFWWAKSSYVKTLPKPIAEKWNKQNVPDDHGSERCKYEGWIGLENPKVNNIYENKFISGSQIINKYLVNIKRKTILNFPDEKTFSYS